MKTGLILTALVAMLVAAGSTTAAPQATVAVERVVDGDTIALSSGRRVRLVQIDAPELGSGECYSRAASRELASLLPVGTRVRIVGDPRLDAVDRYGRRLAYVFKGRELINLTLVARGAATPWFYDGDRGRYAGTLLAAARSAKAASRGLWRACPGTRLDPTRAVSTQQSAAPFPPAPGSSRCHPSYEGECLDPAVSDYDCAGGSGNGPGYVQGTVRVVGPDVYRLDSDGDGFGCE